MLADAAAFLLALTGQENPIVTFQTFDDDHERQQESLAKVLHGTLTEHQQELSWFNSRGAGIFLNINETDLKGRKKTNIVSLRALMTDEDNGRSLVYSLPPSAIVGSGRGPQTYWFLRHGEPLEEFEPAMKHLLTFYRTDPKVWGIQQVMRLPGFLWRKKEPPRLVTLVEVHPERIYSIAEVLAAHPLPDGAKPAQKIRRIRSEVKGDHPLHERIKRASAYLAKLPSAISGQAGHDDCWNAALTVVRGFSLPAGVAFDLLSSEFNPRCTPPWSDRELEHKIEDAEGSYLPAGYLLEARTPRLQLVSSKQGNVSAEQPNVSLPHDPCQDFITDNIVAKRFIALHASELRYVDTWKRWLAWRGGRWEFDETRAVDVLARGFCKRVLVDAVDAGTKDLKSAIEFQKRPRIEAVVALSRCDPRVSRRPSDFDKDPWLFNCVNGTLDLRTGSLQPHAQEDHITKASPVAFDPAAACPVWNRFLEEIFPDPLVRAYVKRAIGYSLTASVREQVLFFAHGGGANGKSVLLGAISYVLGHYGKTAAPELLMVKTNEKHETELADLAGVRLVTTIETESGRRFAEAKTKFLTGEDRIKARFLYADFFEFEPTFKLWLASNHKPNIKGTDEGIWRRFHMIPFTVSIPREKQDKRLPEKLRAEGPGILRWALEGCLEWQRDGLQPPAAVLNAVKSYRDEMDTVGQFLSERCIVAPSLYVSTKDLYLAYTTWCEETGEHAVTQKSLGMTLQERGLTPSRGNQGRAWNGLALRPKDDATMTHDGSDTFSSKFSYTRVYVKDPGNRDESDMRHGESMCSVCGEPSKDWHCSKCVATETKRGIS